MVILDWPFPMEVNGRILVRLFLCSNHKMLSRLKKYLPDVDQKKCGPKIVTCPSLAGCVLILAAG